MPPLPSPCRRRCKPLPLGGRPARGTAASAALSDSRRSDCTDAACGRRLPVESDAPEMPEVSDVPDVEVRGPAAPAGDGACTRLVVEVGDSREAGAVGAGASPRRYANMRATCSRSASTSDKGTAPSAARSDEPS